MRPYIIADNQFITSTGISTLLKERLSAELIIHVSTINELQSNLKVYRNSAVILDYTLFDFVSMEQMLIVKAAFPKSSWMLFSDELVEHTLRWILTTDPTISVAMKNDSKEQIVNILESITKDIPCVCYSVEQIIMSSRQAKEPILEKLTLSERTILHEIALGKTTKEIAYDKNLSFHTVNSHRKNIFRKLEINNVHEAVKYAIRAGIFDVAEYYI